MTKAVFTFSENSVYDDQRESRYHFPRRYLAQATSAVGDWVVYYEPRRNNGPSSSSGRLAYFAMAQLVRIEPDTTVPEHYYAYVREYIEFDKPVPFREGSHYYESGLVKPDGTTSRGAFGRAVRRISDEEFAGSSPRGLAESYQTGKSLSREQSPLQKVSIVTQILQRKYRDAAFRRHVRVAYDNTCAVTGWQLLNGGGRPEVQAAHIRPVEENGPDTVRNGVALTGTFHWLFDRGLITFDDTLHVIVSSRGLPGGLQALSRPDRRLRVSPERDLHPHPTFLAWHRNHRFKP